MIDDDDDDDDWWRWLMMTMMIDDDDWWWWWWLMTMMMFDDDDWWLMMMMMMMMMVIDDDDWGLMMIEDWWWWRDDDWGLMMMMIDDDDDVDNWWWWWLMMMIDDANDDKDNNNKTLLLLVWLNWNVAIIMVSIGRNWQRTPTQQISFVLTSRDNFLKNGALIWVIAWPVAVDPVNEISGTSGCWTIAEPALGPLPKTKLHTPGGSPIHRNKECTTLLACMIQLKLMTDTISNKFHWEHLLRYWK